MTILRSLVALRHRLGMTEGQLYTVGLGLVVAVLCTALGLPPVLRGEAPPAPPEAGDDFVALGGTDQAAELPSVTATAPSPTLAPLDGPFTLPTSSGSFSSEPPRDPPAAAATSTTTTTTAPKSPPRPLALVDAGWFSAQAGTPLAATGVPEGSLPAGLRAGQVDKYAFFRLRGGTSSLVLRVVDGGRSGPQATAGAVRLCPATSSDWEPGTAVGSGEAPAYETDPARCTSPTVEGDRFLFDLAGRSDITSARGFAVVPVTSVGGTFQLAFAKDAA